MTTFTTVYVCTCPPNARTVDKNTCKNLGNNAATLTPLTGICGSVVCLFVVCCFCSLFGIYSMKQNKVFKLITLNGILLFANPIVRNLDNGVVEMDGYSFSLSNVKKMHTDKKTGQVTLDFTGESKDEVLCDSTEFANEYADSLSW